MCLVSSFIDRLVNYVERYLGYKNSILFFRGILETMLLKKKTTDRLSINNLKNEDICNVFLILTNVEQFIGLQIGRVMILK